jgi:hypothetical protein
MFICLLFTIFLTEYILMTLTLIFYPLLLKLKAFLLNDTHYTALKFVNLLEIFSRELRFSTASTRELPVFEVKVSMAFSSQGPFV